MLQRNTNYHLRKNILGKKLVFISLTKRCPLNCRHCFVKKNKGDFPANKLHTLIDELARSKAFDGLAFTGGEPFIVFNTLKRAIQHAHTRGLITAVVTSGYWAGTRSKAERFLKNLLGLDEISVSLDKYHLEQVPLKNIENLLAAAEKFKIERMVKILVPSRKRIQTYIKLCKKYSCSYHVQNIFIKRIKNNKQLFKDAESNTALDMGSGLCHVDEPYIDEKGEVFYCCGSTGLAGKDNNLFYLGKLNRKLIRTNFNAAKRKRIKDFL